MRRFYMLLFPILVMASGSSIASEENSSFFKVVLLGTGAVAPQVDRFGPATLVQVNGENLLFDCGRSCIVRLAQMKIRPRSVRLFITHLHSDHVNGVPDLWLSSWMGAPDEPLSVTGPPGTEQMIFHLAKAYAADTDMRMTQGGFTRNKFLSRDIQPGVVYEANGIKVTAFDVDHGEHLKPAYGYRIDYEGRSVVVSGDTRFSENLIRNSMGVDVLVHEVAMAKAPLIQKVAMVRQVIGLHTTPDAAARVFEKTKPGLAVYTHIMAFGGEAGPKPADFLAETKKTYGGRVIVGEDLMTIDIGKEITVAGFEARCPM